MSDDTNRSVVAEFFPKMIAHTLDEPDDDEETEGEDVNDITTHNKYPGGNEYIEEKENVDESVWRVEAKTIRVHYECGICKRRADSKDELEHATACPAQTEDDD